MGGNGGSKGIPIRNLDLEGHKKYIVSYIFHLSKHLNLVRCLVLAPGHVAEVDQIPDGWHNWVEEEAEAQEDEEVPSS